jgi:signal transduction histidine kinase
MAERLDQAVLAELLGMLAHDLRNPLSALESNLGFLETELAPKASGVGEVIEDLRLSCDGLGRIIDAVDLLGRHLLEERRSERVTSPVPLVLGAALEGAQASARSHWVELVVAPDSLRSAARVRAGRDMLVRAIQALLQNAIQHAPQGSEVHVVTHETASSVVFRIQDSGPALESEFLEDAFSAEGQLRAKRSRGGRYGKGLGLFCARVCANAAGVELRLANQPGGNAFEIFAERA